MIYILYYSNNISRSSRKIKSQGTKRLLEILKTI